MNSAYAAMLYVHLIAVLLNYTEATGISLINFIPAQINRKSANLDTIDFPPSVFYMKAQVKHITSTSVNILMVHKYKDIRLA